MITFGLNADNVPLAAAGAAIAGAIVLLAGVIAHKPLANVPENTLNYGVGLLLATIGTFWAIEGLGVFREGGESLEWPGGDLALLGLLAAWLVLSRVLVRVFPGLVRPRPVRPVRVGAIEEV